MTAHEGCASITYESADELSCVKDRHRYCQAHATLVKHSEGIQSQEYAMWSRLVSEWKQEERDLIGLLKFQDQASCRVQLGNDGEYVTEYDGLRDQLYVEMGALLDTAVQSLPEYHLGDFSTYFSGRIFELLWEKYQFQRWGHDG